MKKQVYLLKTPTILLNKIPRGILVITGTYLVIVALMLPFREVGYLDDFAYNLTVKNFLHTGHLKILDWSATSLVTQVLWGAVFSLVFGFSYKTLHLATCVFLYIGLLYYYLLLKLLSFNEKQALILTLFLLSFPTLLRFSFSFMSVTYYLTLMIVTLYYCVKYLRSNSSTDAFFVAFLSGVTMLERQLGILIPFSLVVTLLLQSIYTKKLRFKQILSIGIPTLIIFLVYTYWLKNGNMTIEQYRYIENMQNIIKYMKPLAIHRLQVTADLYEETIYRIAYFIHNLTVFHTPLVLIAIIPSVTLLKTFVQKKKNLLISVFIALLFFYWRLLIRAKGPNIFTLQILPAPAILNGYSAYYQSIWQIIWNILTIISIPLFTIALSLLLDKFVYLFLKIKPKKNWRLYLYFLLCSLLVSLYYIGKGRLMLGIGFLTEELPKQYLVFLLLEIIFGLILYAVLFFRINRKHSNSISTWIVLFLLLFTLLHLIFSSFGLYLWIEYLVPFVPLFLIGTGILLKKYFPSLLFILAFSLLLFTIIETKKDYDHNGVLWEGALALMKEQKVEPREIGLHNWAWIPFFYYESSFQQRLREVNGDKFKITQAHTWWGTTIYNPQSDKFGILYQACPAEKPNDWSYMNQVKTQSLFSNERYCFVWKK